jgi:hypothetical protein
MPNKINLVFCSHARKLLSVTFFMIWAIIAITLYIYGLDISLDLRIWVFNNYCPQELSHGWNQELDNKNWVDWCGAFWWHPFRLISRCIVAIVFGGLISISARALLLNSKTPLKTAFLLALAISSLHILFFALFEPAMKNYFFHACFRGFDPNILRETCAQQLGFLGDQRFFYPIGISVTCWLFHVKHRPVQANPI